jgi:putative addiction module killer protein
MLEASGNKLKLPHSKSLGKGLFELRERRYGYRIYYGFLGEFIIILLAVGDKKGQAKDISIARERLLEIREEKL